MSRWSSFKETKVLFENFRKFVNEESEYKSNDFCTEFPEVCKGALGTVRANMPQIASAEDFGGELAAPPPKGLETNEPEKIPDLGKAARDYLDSSDDGGPWPSGDQVAMETVKNVDPANLKPTQKDIYMDNALKKYQSGLASVQKGSGWAPWNASILVSKDGYVLDGHHRWAATIIFNDRHPEAKKAMTIERVGMPIEDLLKVANAYSDATGAQRHAAGGTAEE